MSNEIIPNENMALAFQDTVPTGSMAALTSYSQGKGKFFTGPDGEETGAIFGVFLYSVRPTRSWWEKDGGGKPPTCWSLDSIKPDDLVPEADRQSEACRGCPNDELGTAKVGAGKACRAKAVDFFLEFADVGKCDKLSDEVPVNMAQLMGPAMVRYSIGNRMAEGGLLAAARAAKRLSVYPQQMIWEWSFAVGKSKSGTAFDYVTLTPIGLCPKDLMPQIMTVVTELKNGEARRVLRAMSSSSSSD